MESRKRFGLASIPWSIVVAALLLIAGVCGVLIENGHGRPLLRCLAILIGVFVTLRGLQAWIEEWDGMGPRRIEDEEPSD